MKLRTIALVPILAIMFVALAACSGNKASNAANNAANAAATAAAHAGGAMQNAGGTAAGMAGGVKNAAAGAMQNAAGSMGGSAAIPNCGAVQAVWVNLNTKVYHEPGDPAFGKTKHGEYLCPSQARAQGFRPAGGAMATHRHKGSTTP